MRQASSVKRNFIAVERNMFFESWLLNISVLIVLLFALIFDYVTKFFSYWYVRHISYETSIPFFGSDYFRVLGIRNSTQDVNSLYMKYPKDKFIGRVKSRIPDLIVKDPDSIKTMLSSDFEYFHTRGICLDKSQDVCLRNNLFYADGEKWTVLRKSYESLLNNMSYEFQSSSDYLPGINGDTNVQKILSKVLDKLFEDLLIGSVDGQLIKKYRSIAQKLTFVERFKTYLMNIFPSLYVMFGFTTLPGELSSGTKSVVEQSVLFSKLKDLGYVHQSEVKENNKKDVEFTFSMLASFVTEGYIPCLNTLTAVLYELALNPKAQEKSRNSTLKDNQEDYLDIAIKEALRLYPAYSIIARACIKTYHPDGGILIDKKVTINVPVEALQRDTEYYADPNVFNPDRFLGDEGASKHGYTYLPFGVGPRKCIGEQLALGIIKSVCKAILEKYHIEPCERTSVLKMTDHNFGRVVDRDIWLRFNPRD